MDLSTFFNVSVDQILNGDNESKNSKGKERLIDGLVQGDGISIAQLLNEQMVELGDLLEIAPLIKASTFKQIVSLVDKDMFNLKNLVKFSPFIDSNTLKQLFDKLHIDDWNNQDIYKLTPFLEKETLINKLSEKMGVTINTKETKDLVQIIKIAPYLAGEMNHFLSEIPLEKIEWEYLMKLAPFINKQSLFELIEKKYKTSFTIEQLIEVIPFLEIYSDKLLDFVSENKMSHPHLLLLAPFLNQEQLITYLKRIDEDKIKVDQLLQYLPFLDEEKIMELFKSIGRLESNDLALLAPFVNKKALSKMFLARDEV